jgi:hypothetical protein
VLRVLSSITSGAVLSSALIWTAVPVGIAPSHVASLEFLIDGRVRWIERRPPYVFDGDGAELFPWLLGPGPHSLAVRVVSAAGTSASMSADITVAPQPPVPGDLVGSFTRTVTNRDVRRTARLRHKPADQPLPTGVWRLQIAATGVIGYDNPRGGAGNEAFVAAVNGTLALEGPASWLLPPARRGGFCAVEPIGSYTWITRGRTLVLTARRDRCADRNSMFTGAWRRM